jgi:tRNA (mo5U34)-methyltransferase
MLDQELALELIRGKSWHHDFEVIPGVRTNGAYDPASLWDELQLPLDMSGLSLADVGASNGYFSFEACKRGARVVAFDFRHKDNSGFGLAQRINGLNEIEHHQINVLDMTSDRFGQFDIVLALGLFYHVSDPYMALANCAALSSNRLLIESYCIDRDLPQKLSSEPVMRFLPDPERFPTQGQPNADRSNFWGFTSTCLMRMVEDIGFVVESSNVREDRVFIDAKRGTFATDTARDVSNDTEMRLNIAYGTLARVPVNGNPDDPEAWTIF